MIKPQHQKLNKHRWHCDCCDFSTDDYSDYKFHERECQDDN